MTEKIIFVKGIGEIKLKKSKRAKRLTIRVKPFLGVIVTVPYLLSYKKAINFVDEKKEWILKSLSTIDDIEEKKTVFNESTVFKTRSHLITFKSSELKRISLKHSDNMLLVKYPENIQVRDEKVQSKFRKIVENVWRQEAENYLPNRTRELADDFNFRYNQLNISNTKSRWGSCSSTDKISLSLHLMRLPDHLIDYVILHELCHTIEKNHGSGFWQLLERISGNAKGLNKELRNYNARVY